MSANFRDNLSKMIGVLRSVGLNDILAFDIETFSPNGFPKRFEDPVVNFSVVTPLGGRGVISLSVIGSWNLEEAMLSLLHELFSGFRGASLLTYNGARFDLEYVAKRGSLYGLGFNDVFSELHHIDVYRVVKWLNIRLLKRDQKSVERRLGLSRSISWISGYNYHESYMRFLRFGNLEPMLYNLEDSYGCLRIASALSRRITGGRR